MTGPLTDTYTIIILLAKWTTFRNYRGRRNLLVMVFVLLTFIRYHSYILVHLPELFVSVVPTIRRTADTVGTYTRKFIVMHVCIFRIVICHLVSCNTIPGLITPKRNSVNRDQMVYIRGRTVHAVLNYTLSLVE